MTSSRRSMGAAVVLLVLIAVAVLGGVSWATLASYELAMRTVSDEHRARVQQAAFELESYLIVVLNKEANRPYTHYFDWHRQDPDIVVLRDGRQLDPDAVMLLSTSPLAQADPPYSWMDLHFQILPDGQPVSPQIPDETAPLPVDRSGFSIAGEHNARRTWDWLELVLPSIDVRERMAAAIARDRAIAAEVGGGDDYNEIVRDPGSNARLAAGPMRRGTVAQHQRGYLPPQKCVDQEVAEQNRRAVPMSWLRRLDPTDTPSEQVAFVAGPFAPGFWVEPAPTGLRKLAFVRSVKEDARVYLQGFIVDWDRLKPVLLAEVASIFPTADIEPADGDEPDDDDMLPLRHLPVLLRVPPIAAVAGAAAWQSIREQVVIPWLAAAVVLALAGAGVRNLIALTERRLQFAYAVTHELRTPLTTFRLYSDMLSAGLVPEPARQQYLDTLNLESQRLSSLVESVLEYARLENHRVKLHVTSTDGASLLRVLGGDLARRCEANGVEPVMHNRLPDQKVLQTDVDLVSQISGVLVNNACRHASLAAEPKVLLELAGENGKIHLDIADTGPGIDRSDARRIFKPFRRGRDADKTARGGVGLGLALARNWAKLLGGRLELVSRHHPQLHGAHFRLTIPSQVDES